MVCDGRGPGSGPSVFFLTSARITRALSKRSATVRNVFSQQGVVGLLSPSQLPLNVSLANRAAGRRHTAPPTTDTLSTFLLYSFLLFSFFLLTLAQRRSVAEQMTRETHQRQFTLNLFDKFSPLEKLI